MQLPHDTNGTPGLISLSAWIEQVGITNCTVWRWRKKGWLTPINICGRLYLSRANLQEFTQRAQRGEFAQTPIVPGMKEGAR
ncbi:MAG: hypothetical protein HY043_18190 [Verrucomicrobia bacterium]|nr:hypothetical protein [Verrucomicrobiota bacterium]